MAAWLVVIEYKLHPQSLCFRVSSFLLQSIGVEMSAGRHRALPIDDAFHKHAKLIFMDRCSN